MKTICTADLHFDESNQVPALASITTLAETTEREKPAIVTISGDLFNRAVKNTAASGFVRLLGLIKRILDVCPIAAVYGTPSHEPAGSLEVFTALGAFNFVIIQPGKAYLLDGGNLWCTDALPDQSHGTLLVVGIPEPTREWLLAGAEGQSAQETAEAMKAALRGILLGLGAIRAQHPEIPCVMLYHGPVEGASMQNGQTIGAGSITIGREDLALVGADYYALGDIHLAQQISGMPAYYPGSAYPVNWGELGQVGFNLVEIEHDDERTRIEESERFNATVTRVDYPHPRRIKSVVDWKDADEPLDHPVNGVQVWQVYRATKEEAREIDPEEILHDMRNFGALEGSRVTVELIPTETVRAAEITETKGLSAKVAVYMQASNAEPPDSESIFTKATQLEREAEGAGLAGASHHVRLRKARVRGHISHHKRLGTDEVMLDLTKYGPGLIALIGPNGIGKTSLGENCHLFPQEWSAGRDGKGALKDAYVLRDGAREVWVDDPRTGEQWRGYIEIEGGKGIECHLFYRALGAEKWTPLAGGKGKQAEYVEEVIKLVGSKRMFLRSAFWTQEPSENNPRIRRATEGEKKAVFAELALSAPYKEYTASAGAKAKAIDTQLLTSRGQVTEKERAIAEEPEILAAITAGETDVKAADAKLAKLTTEGKALAAKVEALAKSVAEQDALGKDIATAADEAQKKLGQAQQSRSRVADYEVALTSRALAQKSIEEHDRLKKQEAAENERLSGINKKRARLSTEYADAIRAHRDDGKKLQAAKAEIVAAQATRQGDRNVLDAKIENARATLGRPVKACPQCGYVDPAVEKELAGIESDEIAWIDKQEDIDRELQDLAGKIIEAEARIAALVEPEVPTLPLADEAELRRIRAALGQIDIAAARATLDTAAKAEQEIATITAQISTLETDAEALKQKVETLRAQLDPQIRKDHAEAVRQYEAARTDYTTAREERAATQAKLEAAQKQLASIERQKCELETLRTSIASMESEAAEWRYLEAATGPDGIPALELDALGPSIAAEANKLLAVLKDYEIDNHYDAIRFDTTRLAGKGAKTRQIEDFTIYCHDTQHDDWVDFALISVGEAVWVDTALMDAFAIIRDRNSGKRSLTQWRDESDAALDAESRRAYFALLQAAHDASGRYQTVVTTHSPEAQEMIAQRIDMRELAKIETRRGHGD